jgi:hypothetical protein
MRGRLAALGDAAVGEAARKQLQQICLRRHLITVYSFRTSRSRPFDRTILHAIMKAYARPDYARPNGPRREWLPMRRKLEAHVAARRAHPEYPRRAPVPDEKVGWRAEWAEYAPDDFLHKSVRENFEDAAVKWAEANDPRELRSGVLAARPTYSATPPFALEKVEQPLCEARAGGGVPARV